MTKVPDAGPSRSSSSKDSSDKSGLGGLKSSDTSDMAKLPQFLRQSKPDLHTKFIDLEWQQRYRLAQGLQISEPASEWTRPSGDDVSNRNRYMNIDPYVNNRVKLKVPDGHSDYINASPIQLKASKSGATKRYIATQGPKEGSLGHIWRMIWHETKSVAVIVMLTQTYEAGREKCFQYYPLNTEESTMLVNDQDEFGDGFRVSVQLIDSRYDERTRSTIRQLRLSSDNESKTVWHFLFSGWPDFLIPEDEDRSALLELIKLTAAKNTDPGNSRIIHCSAGVGRSGTFIALDYLLGELEEGALDNVPTSFDPVMETVDSLRKQRMMMVQGETQFHFLYDVIKEQWIGRHGPAGAQD